MIKLTVASAKELLHSHMQNTNLRRHCYAVGLTLRAFYEVYVREGRDVGSLSADEWEIIGILHDSDWEITTPTPEQHTIVLLNWLKDYEVPEELLNVFRSHNTGFTHLRDPETLLEWTLECCDELTGFIVATALVRPDKKLTEVEVASVVKKFKQKEFARAVNREQITQCVEKLNVPLERFVEVTLTAMKNSAAELGL